MKRIMKREKVIEELLELDNFMTERRFKDALRAACDILSDNNIGKWFQKGRESVYRHNKSGCCCIIDDSGKVIQACEAHINWFNEALDRSKS